MRRATLLIAVRSLIGGLMIWACGGEETPTSPGGQQQPPPPTVVSVAVTPSTAALVSLGETVQLTASARDASGNTISDETFTWSSSDASISTVSTSGLVTAVANGSATIMATTDGVNGTAALEVNQVATQLVFGVQPMTESFVDLSIIPAVQVPIQDALGSPVAGATDAVTVAIGANPSGGMLSGTLTVAAVDGIATFADLQIDQAGNGYTLVGTSGTLPAVTSAAFDVLLFTPPGTAVTLSGFGAATIDGIFSPAEWDNAGRVHFLAKVPPNDGGGNTPTTILIMNDASNLYLAVKIGRPSYGTTSVGFEFDNNNDGVREEGDDVIVTNVSGAGISLLADDYRTFLPPCPSGSLCGLLDADNGGTNDGTAAGFNDGSFTYIELSHPLDSPDDAHDFSLAPGVTVGFTLFLRMFSLTVCDSRANFQNCVADTDFPAPIGIPGLYGDIVVATSP